MNTSFLPFAESLLEDAASVAANAIDVLDSLSGMELDSTMADVLQALEASLDAAMEAAREAAEKYTEYVAEEAEAEESEEYANSEANSEIDYALDYYEMLD